MTKILIFIRALEIGGAEKITVDLIEHMDKKDLKIYFLVLGDKIGAYEEQVKAMGCEVIHIDNVYHPYIRYFKNLDKVWEKYGPFDVIHTHTLLNNGINAYYAAKKGVHTIISHSHSTNSNRDNNMVTRIYENLMKRAIAKYATDYLACGQQAGEYLYGRELFGQKGVIIQNGVDSSRYAPDMCKRVKWRKRLHVENDYVIGHVARLAEVKNHCFVLQIVRELKNRGIPVKYIIVGDGPQKEKIEKMMRELWITDSVQLLGSRKDIDELQNTFDMIIYPSLYEGLPVALVEAQMNRLPCLISDRVSQEARLTEKTCFLSLQRSIKEWADEAEKLLNISREDNPLLPIASQYDIKTSAEMLRRIYENDE